jgi:hypothetical protein
MSRNLSEYRKVKTLPSTATVGRCHQTPPLVTATS